MIKTGEYIGTVEAVRWRGTRIRTFNNNIVIVPNSVLARDRVEVYPRNNLNARVLSLSVDAKVPPAEVIGLLTRAASSIEGISREVPCLARVANSADSMVTYEIKYFTEDYSQRDRIDAEVRKAAVFALGRVEPDDVGKASEAIIKFTTDKDEQTRKEAISSLCIGPRLRGSSRHCGGPGRA